METRGFSRLINFKYFVGLSAVSYGVYFYFIAKQQKENKLRLDFSRRLSRCVGYASKIPLPPYIRSGMFRMFCSSYGVNLDEIKEDLNDFRNFN